VASDLPAAEAAVELRAPAVPAPTADELVALDELPGAGPWEVFGHRLWLTNLDKVLFPGRPGEEPLTKRELARSDFASPERLRQPGATSPARSDFASPERLRQPGATSPARSNSPRTAPTSICRHRPFLLLPFSLTLARIKSRRLWLHETQTS